MNYMNFWADTNFLSRLKTRSAMTISQRNSGDHSLLVLCPSYLVLPKPRWVAYQSDLRCTSNHYDFSIIYPFISKALLINASAACSAALFWEISLFIMQVPWKFNLNHFMFSRLALSFHYSCNRVIIMSGLLRANTSVSLRKKAQKWMLTHGAMSSWKENMMNLIKIINPSKNCDSHPFT